MISADRVVPTTCPYCGVGCKLELHIKDDYIYKVTSPFDSPVNHGNLCVKGRFGYDFIYNKDRVTTPLIRKKTQKPGLQRRGYALSVLEVADDQLYGERPEAVVQFMVISPVLEQSDERREIRI